jgi:hypothetical protein
MPLPPASSAPPTPPAAPPPTAPARPPTPPPPSASASSGRPARRSPATTVSPSETRSMVAGARCAGFGGIVHSAAAAGRLPPATRIGTSKPTRSWRKIWPQQGDSRSAQSDRGQNSGVGSCDCGASGADSASGGDATGQRCLGPEDEHPMPQQPAAARSNTESQRLLGAAYTRQRCGTLAACFTVTCSAERGSR